MSTETKEFTEKELEQMLLAKRKAKKLKRDKERKAYVDNRDENIDKIITEGLALEKKLIAYKEKVANVMIYQHEKLSAYGEIRSNSKGGFRIMNALGNKKVVRRRDTEPTWDERAEKGVMLLKDFLADVVKKRDVKTYELLMGFLTKNEKGDLEHSRVMELLKHQDYSTDQRWVEGISLVKEGYSNVMKGYGYQLQYRPAEGDKWENINLAFSSL